ncbi:MAG: hypothetical protein ACJA2M_000295 [Polaribacter sp.]|jgi:hypothetical protein
METLLKLLRDSYDLQNDNPELSAYWHLQSLRSSIKYEITKLEIKNKDKL